MASIIRREWFSNNRDIVSFSEHARRMVETDLTTKSTKDTKLKSGIKWFVLRTLRALRVLRGEKSQARFEKVFRSKTFDLSFYLSPKGGKL